MSPWVREQEGRAGLLAWRAACAGDRRFVPGGDSFRQCALLSSASLPGVQRCQAAGALPTVACCRAVLRCQARCRGAEWVPHRQTALRCRACRVAWAWRVAGAGVLPDAVALYQVGAAPPGGAPLPTVRVAGRVRRQTRCVEPNGAAPPSGRCRGADLPSLPTVPCCRPCRVAGGARCRALLDAR